MGRVMRSSEYFVTILIVFSLVSAACGVPSNNAIYPETGVIKSLIEPGDTVKIGTKDKKEISFVVVEVTDEAIIGENVKVEFTDITYLLEKTNGQDNAYYTLPSFPYLEPDDKMPNFHLPPILVP